MKGRRSQSTCTTMTTTMVRLSLMGLLSLLLSCHCHAEALRGGSSSLELPDSTTHFFDSSSSSTTEAAGADAFDATTDRSNQRWLSSSATVVGNDGSPSSKFPLGLCEGDCDQDSDCQKGLVCRQRNSGDPVPGCSASSTVLSSHTDFCAYASSGSGSDSGSSSGSTSSTFYLKRYWQPGYHWQGEHFDRDWCLKCYGSECGSGDPMILVNCKDDNPTKLEFVNYGSEFQIKIANQNLCVELNSDHFFYLDTCSSTDDLQRFVSQNGDRNGTGRFEMSPVTKSDFCVTQRHEPRGGEAIRWELCSHCRTIDTNYWNKI